MFRLPALVSILLAAVPLAACVAPTSATQEAAASEQPKSELGSSFATAVVINEVTEFAGVPAEYDWLARNRPGWKVEGQALVEHGGKPYDILTIRKGNATEEVYFDISKFFGRL